MDFLLAVDQPSRYQGAAPIRVHLARWKNCLEMARTPLIRMPESRAIPALGGCALFVIYTITMTIAGGVDASHLYSAGVNVVALFSCFAIVSAILNFIVPASRPPVVRGLIHIVMAVLFAFGWYALVLAGFAIGDDWVREGMTARAFTQNTMVWQIHYGAMMYAILILYRAWRAERAARAKAPAPNDAAHLLLRQGSEMVRISPVEVVRVSGAGDYCEVVTRTARLMSTKTLDHFEKVLAPEVVRIHRSHLVRIGAIERTEPAGNGRLQIHLVNSDSMTTSRAGGRLLRRLVR